MPFYARILLVAGALLLPCPDLLGHGSRAVRVTGAYYYPAYFGPQVVYFSPVYPLPAVTYAPLFASAPLPSPFAVPTPAPPSGFFQTGEPPLKLGAAQAPKVTESSSKGGKAPTKGEGAWCQVGFWNVSGRTLTLTIDGKTQVLAPNQNLTLRLGRQFAWRVDQGSSQTEHVPADKNTLEIVLRR
jgi:hypothetical protein